MVGKTKYAHLFRQGNDHYLYIDDLAVGNWSRAQRVWDTATGEIKADNEVSIIRYLDSTRAAGTARPNIAELLSSADIVSREPDAAGGRKVSRVSYWKYYNGGTLNDFIRPYLRHKPQGRIPLPIVARFTHQILSCLKDIYALDVLHRDVSGSNNFVHFDSDPENDMPDFYLGDFGNAKRASSIPPADPLDGMPAWAIADGEHPRYRPLHADIPKVIDLIKTLACCGRLPNGGAEECQRPDNATLRHTLAGLNNGGLILSIIEDLQSLYDNPVRTDEGPAFPDLSAVIEAAQSAEKVYRPYYMVPNAPHLRKAALETQESLRPKLYETAVRVLSATLVLGPWYVARFDTETRRVTGFKKEPHHRPNADDPDSDTNHDSDSHYGDGENDAVESLVGRLGRVKLTAEKILKSAMKTETDAPGERGGVGKRVHFAAGVADPGDSPEGLNGDSEAEQEE